MRDITWLEYWLLMFVICITTWQLMWFFFIDDGRVQKWRLRNAIDNIRFYIKEHTEEGCIPIAVSVPYRKKEFSIGILKTEVNYRYSFFQIFINGEEVAKYHCLKHTFLNSYLFETLNGRWSGEVVAILHACNKHLKKLDKAANKDKIPAWKEKSYFN